MKYQVDDKTEIETGEIQSVNTNFDNETVTVTMDDNSVHTLKPQEGESLMELRAHLNTAIDSEAD